MTTAEQTAPQEPGAEQLGDVGADVLALLEKHDAARPPASSDASAPGGPTDAASPAKPETPAAAAAPADLKPFEDRFAQLQDEKAKLAEREKAIAAREAALPSAEAFRRDPVSELRRLAASVVGDDDAKVAAFLAGEIYEPLMVEVLGMKDPDKLDPAIRNRAEMRRLERSLEAEKRAREEQQAEMKRQQEEAAHQTKLQQIKGTLTQWIQGKASDYPHLSRYSQSAADDVFDIMLENATLTPEKAAELAEEHYRKERQRYTDQLLDGTRTTAAGTQATKSGQSATRATSLTNSGATEAVATGGDKPPEDPEASALYWAERLERDPEAMKRMITRRR